MTDCEKIYTLQSLDGIKAKQNFIKANKGNERFCKFLYYALNPMLTYNVSEERLRRGVSAAWLPHHYHDIFEVCDRLSSKKGVYDSTIHTVCSFINTRSDKAEREIYIKLLSKTLRLGVTAKTVNKIIPGLIPEWEVQQAFPIDKYPIKAGTEFWLTQKLNGVRATYYNGELIARSGVPYKGLEHIIECINSSPMKDYVLDGELILKDKNGLSDNEAFRAATGILNSDNMNKTAICYTVFDAVPMDDFESKSPSIPYSNRRTILNSFSDSQTDSVRILPVLYNGTDQSQIDKLLEQMVCEDKEGLIVNTDVPYKRTRHKGILKVKRFYTMDLPIMRCEEGTGRLLGTLGALVLKYKDNEVKVGSGFTDEQRKTYWENRDNLSGILCEVKYKEISSDKNTGLESLQFPVFIQLREDKTEVSYG